MSELAAQSDIYKIQDIIAEMPQADTKTRHHFSDGLYVRESFLPAGTVCVGAAHKTSHMYMVIKGKCKVASQFETIEIEAPYMGETTPGTKRVCHAETDCVWITFHPTELTDLKEIEEALIEPKDIL